MIALNIIDDLIARCVNTECNETCAYSLLKKHQRTCKHRPKKCLRNMSSEIEVFDVSNNEAYSSEVIEVDRESVE